MGKTKPFVFRWRDAVMDDQDLSFRAKVAAMPLVRHADNDGKNCYPGAGLCATEMSCSKKTILRGWEDLEGAGYLELMPLPQARRRTHGATKVLRFPNRPRAEEPKTKPEPESKTRRCPDHPDEELWLDEQHGEASAYVAKTVNPDGTAWCCAACTREAWAARGK